MQTALTILIILGIITLGVPIVLVAIQFVFFTVLAIIKVWKGE